ncbi:MAG: hypothetical protein ABIJ26_06450, partial [Candidatus Margulisiibacteriota bacterium]
PGADPFPVALRLVAGYGDFQGWKGNRRRLKASRARRPGRRRSYRWFISWKSYGHLCASLFKRHADAVAMRETSRVVRFESIPPHAEHKTFRPSQPLNAKRFSNIYRHFSAEISQKCYNYI